MIGHTERRFTMSENENKVENIVAAVRSGDYSELDTLIKLCVFVPETAISAAQKLGFEHDDLRQEGVVALLYALHSYDPALNTSFRTYSSKCIKRRIASVLRSATSSKRLSMADYISLDSGCEIAQQQNWMQDVELRDIKERLFRHLSKMEAEVFRLYLAGLSYKEIAGKIGKSEKSVGNALRRIRGKLRVEA